MNQVDCIWADKVTQATLLHYYIVNVYHTMSKRNGRYSTTSVHLPSQNAPRCPAGTQQPRCIFPARTPESVRPVLNNLGASSRPERPKVSGRYSTTSVHLPGQNTQKCPAGTQQPPCIFPAITSTLNRWSRLRHRFHCHNRWGLTHAL